jgi:1,4-alpha-glucan branching enzyme
MAKKTTKRRVTFKLSAPQAKSVLLAGDFTGWNQSPVNLKKRKSGLWKTTVSLAPGTYEYRFIVDGQWQDDPGCTCRNWNRFGTQNCVCEVSATLTPDSP